MIQKFSLSNEQILKVFFLRKSKNILMVIKSLIMSQTCKHWACLLSVLHWATFKNKTEDKEKLLPGKVQSVVIDVQGRCIGAKFLQSHLTSCDAIDCGPSGSSCPWDSPGKNTGVGCHALLQGIFPTQGVESASLMSPALAGGFYTISTTWEAHNKAGAWSSSDQQGFKGE